MNIILWRHAQAEEGTNDLARRLTDKGRKQAHITAAWLHAHLRDTPQVWTSEARRSQETAAALKLPQTIVPLFNPESPPQTMLHFLQQLDPTRQHIIVGHQPWIGQLAALLLNGNDAPLQSWRVKKSGLIWLNADFNDHRQSELKAALCPELFHKSNG